VLKAAFLTAPALKTALNSAQPLMIHQLNLHKMFMKCSDDGVDSNTDSNTDVKKPRRWHK